MRLPAPKLDQSTGQSSPRVLSSIFNGSQNTRSIQKLVVLHIPGLTSNVLSLPPLPTSATSNPNLPIPIPLPLDPAPTLSDPSDLPTHFRRPSFGRSRGTLWRHSVHYTHLFSCLSHSCPGRRIQERISGSCFITVFPLRSFTCTAAESTKNKNPEQYLLSVEQMVENDYPVPSYLADVFRKPEGWIETSRAAADEEGSHTV